MQQFIEALAVIMTPTCLGFMIIGTAVGILFGAMPGLSATLAVAVFIPVTYAMEAEVAVPLLIALYIGGISGGHVEYNIQIYVTLILISLGNLKFYARLCFCIFGYPLLYQRTGKAGWNVQ